MSHLPDGGVIINTSSINGLRGNKKLIDYSATKAAVLALTYSLAQSLSDHASGAANVTSLLDRPQEHWRGVGGERRRGGGKYRRAAAFLAFAHDVVDALREGTGWDVEYPGDIWRLSRLPGLVLTVGDARAQARFRFDRIAQPWLRELSKRWIRLRLCGGRNVGTVTGNLQALTRFSEFLTTAPNITSLADIDRALLERFLAWLTTEPIGQVTGSRHIGGLNLFFESIRRHHRSDQYPPVQCSSPMTTQSRRRAPRVTSPSTS